MMFRGPAIVTVAISLAACGGAKNEAPVQLQPGRYGIQISGVLPRVGGSTTSLCILPDRAAAFADAPLTGLIDIPTDACKVDKSLTGNSFNGSIACSSNSAEFGSQTANIVYDGSLTVNSFRLNGTFEVSTPQGGLSQRFSADGTRSGDC